MSHRRISTLATLATAAALVVAPPGTAPAAAGGPGEPIFGNFNQDEFPDRVVLGAINPDLCSIILQYGAGPGVFVPPIAFVYTPPEVTGLNCPDIGTAFDADGDDTDELWLAWSNGPPAGISYNRLAIDNDFSTITTLASPLAAPVYLGTADIEGTGVPTPYSIGPGGYYTSIIRGGTSELGPQQWCSADTPTVVHARFDGNAAVDTLVSYRQACTDNSSGVVVLLDDGTVRHLEHDPTGRSRWRVTTTYLDSDRLLDVRTENVDTGRIEHYHSTGTGTFVRGPDANTDRVTLTQVRPLAIDVLANDYVAADARVTVTSPPRYGQVQVMSDRRIRYAPNPDHGRTDRFTYTLVRDGRRSSAVVYITFPPTG